MGLGEVVSSQRPAVGQDQPPQGVPGGEWGSVAALGMHPGWLGQALPPATLQAGGGGSG